MDVFHSFYVVTLAFAYGLMKELTRFTGIEVMHGLSNKDFQSLLAITANETLVKLLFFSPITLKH